MSLAPSEERSPADSMSMGVFNASPEDPSREGASPEPLNPLPRTTYDVRGKEELARIVLSFLLVLQTGMNDGALGANLDSIQSHYHLSYSVVSLIFLANVAGWFIACTITPFLLHHIGLHGTLIFASLCNIAGSTVIATSSPFYGLVAALVLTGICGCIYESGLAIYAAHFADGRVMGLVYAAYGLGALCSPLIIAGWLRQDIPWYLYYYVPVGLAIVSLPFAWLAFRTYKQPEEPGAAEGLRRRFILAVSNPIVLAGGVLSALSWSCGDILSSWIVSFMTTIREGNDSKMRYVLAGFWGGQTLGRLSLSQLTITLGEQLALTAYLFMAIGVLAVLQFSKSITGDALAVALTGFFLGPVTPTIVSASSKRLASSIVSPAVTLMTAMGLTGSALAPLIVGFVNNAGGLRFLATEVMGLMAVMIPLWCLTSMAMKRRAVRH